MSSGWNRFQKAGKKQGECLKGYFLHTSLYKKNTRFSETSQLRSVYKKMHQKLLKLPMSCGNAAGNALPCASRLDFFPVFSAICAFFLDFSAVLLYNTFVPFRFSRTGSGKTTRGGSPRYFPRKPSEGFPCTVIRPCPGSFRYWSDDPYKNKKRRNCYVCILAS